MIIELPESTPTWWGIFFKPFIVYPLATIGIIVLAYWFFSWIRIWWGCEQP